MRIVLAVRVFFLILFNRQTAESVQRALEGTSSGDQEPKQIEQRPKKPAQPAPKRSSRSEAVTLLATLQRESRLIDIVKEPLDDYTDEQVGAAARDVLKNCGKTLDRLFALQPLVLQEEGDEIELPTGFDPETYRITGNVEGQPPFRGNLVHHGWNASQCNLPAWKGSESGKLIVAAAEIEIQ